MSRRTRLFAIVAIAALTQVAGREVVGAVHDHVPAVAEDAVDRFGAQSLLVADRLDIRVEAADPLLATGWPACIQAASPPARETAS